jgi:hypothetical protein
MKSVACHIFFTALTISILVIPAGKCLAWVGLELDGKATAAADPYGATGQEGHGSLWELSGRLMFHESFGRLDTEFHWLGQGIRAAGDTRLLTEPSGTAFRSLDMEKTHSQDSDGVVMSEIDRLSLTLNTQRLSLTVGRQAVTWGEAFYFNLGDLFGAFPVTETNRRYKPGIDAAAATLDLGVFTSLSLVSAPVDEGEDSIAAQFLFPLGPGTASATLGRILENDKAGTGYSLDVAGTQIYGSLLVTETSGGEDYSQAVVGAQRQLGPYTSVTGELYRNGWSTGDPDDYPLLLLTGEYANGSVLTLGKYNLALQLSRQVSPLLTLTPAVFGNLSDGSVLLRMDGGYSVSDFTDLTGGLFIGLGERPDGIIPRSEYGGIPISLYLEIVHSI